MSFGYNIILASNSPRRKELLSGLDIEYKIMVLPDIEEIYPSGLKNEEVPGYLAKEKAKSYMPSLKDNDLLITADTVVIFNNKIYGKPIDEEDVKQMLRDFSGNTHRVVTGVCLTSKEKQHTFNAISDVRFAQINDTEIDYYVSKYKPLDKAGAYGIQEWIGYIAVEYISGSYFNIMGLPIQRLYQELKKF